jgi:hypothetical protein
LQHIDIQFMDSNSDDEVINTMLRAATKLRSFASHKLRVRGPLEFASNDLETLRIRRSDSLQGVLVWAPRLQELPLLACYALDVVRILEDHPLRAHLLPPNDVQLSKFDVDATNSILGYSAGPHDDSMTTYLQHPRAKSFTNPREEL